MKEISATEAARQFSELLDAVEHSGESFTVVRHGKAIAEMTPAAPSSGGELLRVLQESPPDVGFARDVASVRELLTATVRWPD